MIEKIPDIVAGLPSLEKIVFVPNHTNGGNKSFPEIEKCVTINEFLKEYREKYLKSPHDIEFQHLPFDYPLCLSFTSGTSGTPKPLLHSTGMFFASIRDFGLHQDITRNDVLFNFSPVGWISWYMFLNCLHLGATLVVYEGDPFEQSPTRYYDLVDKFGISSAYIWSSTLEKMEQKKWVPTSRHTLKSLRQLLPVGSPAKPHSFDFLTKIVKPNLFCAPAYGATEFFGLILGMDSNQPVYKGEIQTASLGMDVRILDDNGVPVVGKQGNAVLANPYPSCPVGLLGDDNKSLLKEMYLSQYPGYWNIGDTVWMNPITKGMVVYGRSDETMNPKGARFSCFEIYFALDCFPGIMDSVCTSQYNSKLDERVILFVKMLPGHVLTADVQKQIRQTIEKHLTHEHVPDIIMEVPDIPYNLTGKKLNGCVKKLINKKNFPESSGVVINPSSIEFFRNLDLGDF